MKLPNIVEYVDQMFGRDCVAYPARSIRASAIGNPCARALVYDQIVIPEPISVSTARIFSLGNLLEDQAVVDFANALKGTDIDIVRDRMPLPNNPQGIGGIVDWWVCFIPEGADRKGRVRVPAEFKSMSPFTYDEIHSMQDMLESSKPWVRKYPAQLLTYMMMTNTPAGMFILRNKLTGEYRQIDVQLDDAALIYCDELLKRAEVVKASVESYGKCMTDAERNACLPPRINYTPDTCGKCDHRSVCIPDMNCAAGIIIDPLWEGEVEAWCNILEQTREAADQHEEANEKLKQHASAMCKGLKTGETRTMMTSTWYVTGKMGKPRTVFDVPDDVREKYKKAAPASVTKKITRVDGGSSEE